MRQRSLELRHRRRALYSATEAYRRSRQRLAEWEGTDPRDPGVRAATEDFVGCSNALYIAADAVLHDILTPKDHDPECT